jgi:fatty-acyl-CoA synthase
VLPELKTVEHVIVTGGADTSALAGSSAAVHAWSDLLAGEDDSYDWRDPDDERDAAALCYTSGTTGHPKGVAYSHRSIWLHSMQICMGDGFLLDQSTKTLTVVPMFHAMAWGLPYAAAMVGADLLMPDRFLQAEPLVQMIGAEQPTLAGAVPTIWADVLRHLDARAATCPRSVRSVVGGSACPPALMEAFAERYGVRIVHAWGMTETSPLGSVSRPPTKLPAAERRRYAQTQGRLPASSRGGWWARTASGCRTTAPRSESSRSVARGSPGRTTATTTPTGSPRTVGSVRATSAP